MLSRETLLPKHTINVILDRLARKKIVPGQMVAYVFVGGLSAIGFGLLISGLRLLTGMTLHSPKSLWIGLVFLLTIFGLLHLRLPIYTVFSWIVGRDLRDIWKIQQSFTRHLTEITTISQASHLLRNSINQAIKPSSLHIYLFHPLSGYYGTALDEIDEATSDVCFPASGALVQLFEKKRHAMFLKEILERNDIPRCELDRLRLLNTPLFVPILGSNQLVGWLALGDRKNGGPYGSHHLRMLEHLSDLAALAIERVNMSIHMERHIRERNALTRVAQGVSFTLTFDDILEMLSAQVSQVLPARDFWVSLLDDETGNLNRVFFLDDDERRREFEGQPIPNGWGLEWEVLSNQRLLASDDYEHECLCRSLIPLIKGVFAWIGVPLTAGDKTIGVISIASRDPMVSFSDSQCDLLQAIADQASGAIFKARLLEDSERRAHQLVMLNQISLNLTSTLETGLLLKQILFGAVELLNCQAGCVYTIDPQTGELIVEDVHGLIGTDIIEKRLPAEAGMIEEAFRTGQAIKAQDLLEKFDWVNRIHPFLNIDNVDIILVPMRIQDRIIGIIELIKRADGVSFTRHELELLTAFTNQAVVSLENARLYTMTDQALAARVDELSVMQRIDRELNGSLDIERALRIALDWAIRQSGAEAGLAGEWADAGVRVMASQGYSSELKSSQDDPESDSTELLQLEVIHRAVQTGRPYLFEVNSHNAGQTLLDGAQFQIVVPIRREQTIGEVLLLESRTPFVSPDICLNFLTRLSDHAAIAIANARLYDEIKAANLAKSLFVSFVAHELKNPMASIKGYTELVVGGMAGPVNEMQAGFLKTVCSNVDRMNTIVSDLNDLTKIQVGNLRLDYRAVEISEVINDVIRSLNRQIDEKRLQLRSQISDDLPPLWADPARLAQIVTNLLSNAQKYTPEGGNISIGAQIWTKQNEVLESQEMVHIWVQDSGIGISEEDQLKIFQQYFRTDSAKEMASGTGLGLAITRSLVEMQGGRIWFESRRGEGTTFHLTIPTADI